MWRLDCWRDAVEEERSNGRMLRLGRDEQVGGVKYGAVTQDRSEARVLRIWS